jgi:hypothetical protein
LDEGFREGEDDIWGPENAGIRDQF